MYVGYVSNNDASHGIYMIYLTIKILVRFQKLEGSRFM